MMRMMLIMWGNKRQLMIKPGNSVMLYSCITSVDDSTERNNYDNLMTSKS